MKTTTTTTTTTATSPGQIFDHIIIIMLENQYLGDVLNNEIMQGFAKKGILLNNSYGVMHPSQTNYIASIAGNLCGVTDDVIPNSKLTQKTIVDLIENATSQLTWKAYMEGYSAHQKKVAEESSGYMTHHNPFHSFKNSTNSENVVDLAQLNDDLTNKTLPNYAWISPNMWNDGHFPMCQTSPTDNTPQPPYNANHLITQSASFLTSLFTQWNLFGDYPDTNTPLPANTLVVVTYDEAMYDNSYLDNVAGGVLGDSPNQIFTLLLGNVIQPLMTSSSDYNYVDEAFNHYSLLKTVETNFGLNDLQANDTDANEFQFLWNKEFQWQAVNADSGLEQLNNTTAMAATNSSFPGLDKPQDINKGFRLLTNIVYLDADNKLQHVWLTEDSGRYQIQPMYTVVSVTTATSLSLVNINGPVSASVGGIVTDDLLLAYIDSSIMELQYCNQSGEGDFTDGHWQPLTAAPANINGPVTALSLLPLPDKSGILLAFADSDGIKSAVYDSNEQQ
ncbi:MAG: hypothetical protein HRT35_27940, partial [Algicola sp.]|nr:hypothetical protein [Algicola sp.]